MSGLSAFALGLCAQQSLLGKTWAGANVVFEPTSPVDVTQPTIAIYAGRGRADVVGDDILNGAGDVRLRFEFFLPAAVTAEGFTFDTEASQALVFALLWRQVEAVRLTDLSPWPSLWRSWTLRIHSLDSARDLFETDKGQKIACAIVELHCECIADPAVGEAPQGLWATFVAALTGAGGELASLASLFAAQIQAASAALPSWQVAMSLLGATAREVQTIGLGPDAETHTVTDVSAAPVTAQETVDVSATPSAGP